MNAAAPVTLRWICVLCGRARHTERKRPIERVWCPTCRERYRVTVELDGYDVGPDLVSVPRMRTVLRLETST